MPLPPAFRVTETADSLRVEWDNREVGSDRGELIGYVLVWLVLVGFALLMAFELASAYRLPPAERLEFDNACVSCCGLPVVLLLVVMMLMRWARRGGREVVEVTRGAITHRESRWLASQPDVYPLGPGEKLVLAWTRPDAEDGQTFEVRADVYLPGGWLGPRALFGERLPDPLKEQLFVTIREFAARAGVPLAFEEKDMRAS